MTNIGAVNSVEAGLRTHFAYGYNLSSGWAFSFAWFMICYMTVLSWADYSYVMPAGAFGYALLTFWPLFSCHESVSPRRWGGVPF